MYGELEEHDYSSFYLLVIKQAWLKVEMTKTN
jgi:hypothetical protein